MEPRFSYKALNIASALLAAVLVVGVMTFASACIHDDGTASVCHAAQIAVAVGGASMAAISILALFVRGNVAAGALSIVVAIGGVFVALAPTTLFPLCMMSTMRCHTLMQPFAQFMGLAIAAVSIVAGIRSFKSRTVQKSPHIRHNRKG